MQNNIFSDNKINPADSGSPVNRKALNEAQFAAATHGTGPLLVIAGAGSGKTRTLVYRMAHLIEQNVAPESILLLTFTRRAAQEMLWRAGQLSNQSCRGVVGGTFHATSNMLLRRHGHYLGFGAGFTIIDRGDAEGIINLIKSSLGLSGAGKRFPTKRMIMNILSGSVNKSRSIEDLVYDQHLHLTEFLDDLYKIQDHYGRFKVDHGLMDYDDLLVNWHRLLTESAEARHEMTSRFSNILVDEYQDTNLLQAEIVRLLAHDHDNVMVVGDDAQSIYSFRGADFYNIMRFPEEYSNIKVVKLEENYRSTQPILSLTNSIIDCAEEKFTKTLFTSMKGGERPCMFAARNEGTEARFVVDSIQELEEQGIPVSQIAVLFRSGYHSYKLEMELTSRYIEFEKRGGLKLTESAHIKDVLSFFRILVNPMDNLSWNRILLQLDKVGPKTAQKILVAMKASPDPFAGLASFKAAPAWRNNFGRLNELIRNLKDDTLTLAAQFDILMEYYDPILEKIYHDDYPKRKKDIDQLRSLVAGYGDVQSFVDDTTLDPPEGNFSTTKTSDSEEGQLILSTIHSAKGLEWDAVFVIGLAEGRFPHQNTVAGEQYEEERRLLYVAATRARKKLYLTYPKELVTPDRKYIHASMSPFLREINPGLYEKKQSDTHRPAASFNTGPALRHPPRNHRPKLTTPSFKTGMTVTHPFFGRGQIKNMPGPRRVEVAFDRHGDKILHLDYAKLEIVE